MVTGASTGIGKSTALELDAHGFRVFAGVRRAEDGAKLQKEGSDRVTPFRLDVTDPDSVAAAAERIKGEVRDAGVWGLVNNAGIAVADVLEYAEIKRLRLQFEVNVIGCVAVTQAFLPLVRIALGRIVQMGST